MRFHPLATAAALALLVSGPASAEPAKFHIAICTASVAQGEDSTRAAEQLTKEYGSVANGGMITKVVVPDDFMSQQETLISNLVALTEDPLMRVIVTNNMFPGTGEAYRRIRAKRKDILLLGSIPLEDPLIDARAADLVLDIDFVSRGYTIPWTAQQLGAKTFVHISFPRHMSLETFGRRRAVMEQACKDLGMKFVYMSAPDPTSDAGVAGAQQFLLEKMPQWIEQFGGPKHEPVAFFATNDAHAEPLIKTIAASRNAIFVEPGSASPLLGYPGALGLNLSAERGNWPAIMKKIEAAVIAKGAGGRMGDWAYSSNYSFVAGLAELGKRVVEGKAKLSEPKDIFDALKKYSPNASWNGSYYTDLSTGTRVKNYFLLYMDTYIFGKGYMGTTSLKIPAKYYTVRK